MSDCPLLTRKDIEIFSQNLDLINTIAQQTDEVLDMTVGDCDIKTGGASIAKKAITYLLVSIISFIVVATAAGGTTALIMYALPYNTQLLLLSMLSQKPTLQAPCITNRDYVLAAAESILYKGLSCSARAQALEEAVNTILNYTGLAVGGVITASLKSKIERFVESLIISREEQAGEGLLALNVEGQQAQEFHDAAEGGARGRRRKHNKNRKTKRSGRRRYHKSRKH